MRPLSIEITIDEIVLHGLAPGHDFATALEAKLTDLVQDSAGRKHFSPKSESSQRTPRVTVGSFEGTHVGEAVAEAVADVLTDGDRQ